MDIIENSDFSIHNIPFGIFSKAQGPKKVATAYGDMVIDLAELYKLGLFDELEINGSVFTNDYLNDFIDLGKTETTAVRNFIQDFLKNPDHELWKQQSNFMFHKNTITLHLPVKIGDYTDFYSSESHARNVGMMFRDPDNALLPNWKHMPVAYHGRSSSIFVSGTNFKRPSGQVKAKDETNPHFSESKRLDFELEMGAIIGKNSDWQTPVSVNEASDYVFGYVLFNDWSARDIQQWEYVPLGPFLGKNFFSSISPWVVTSEALAPFKTTSKTQNPSPLDYLRDENAYQYDINLQVFFETKEGQQKLISQSNYKNMYWTINQQIAHHTINGCNLRVGDILASGTISGDTPDSFGSLLEITWAGSKHIEFEDGSKRTFVEDGDSIIIQGFGEKNNIRVGFGQLKNTVLS